MFALGADPERIEWGIEIARDARVAAGLDPDELAYGAYVNVVCHSDLDRARDLVRGGLSTFARFSVMHGEVVGPVSDTQREVMNELHEKYDMKSHTRADSQQASVLTPDFVDSYAIVGNPEVCIERVRTLEALGLDKLIFVGQQWALIEISPSNPMPSFVTKCYPAWLVKRVRSARPYMLRRDPTSISRETVPHLRHATDAVSVHRLAWHSLHLLHTGDRLL